MTFEYAPKLPTREPRKLFDVSYTLRMAGADNARRLTGCIILQPWVIKPQDVEIGDTVAVFVGKGADAGKIQLNFKCNLRYRDIKLRPEQPGKPKAMVLTMKIPTPLDLDRTIRECEYKWVEDKVLQITLPFDVVEDEPEEDPDWDLEENVEFEDED